VGDEIPARANYSIYAYKLLLEYCPCHTSKTTATADRSKPYPYKLIKSEKILAPSKIPSKSAEDILAERYAKGELAREQYMQMKEDLKKVQ